MSDLEVPVKISVAIVSERESHRIALKKHFEALKILNISLFERGDLALAYLKTNAVNLLYCGSRLPDMHWMTFIRHLRTSENVFFTPLVFFFDKPDIQDKKSLDFLKCYGVSQIEIPPFTADRLSTALRVSIAEIGNEPTIQSSLNQAKFMYRNRLSEKAMEVYEQITLNELRYDANREKHVPTKKNAKVQLELVHTLLEDEPENYNFKFALLAAFIKRNDVNQARQLFDELIAELKSANESFWLWHLGDLCASMKFVTFCEEIIRLYEEMPKKDWQADLLRARMCMNENDFDEGHRFVLSAHSIASQERPEIFNLLGVVERRRGSLSKAKECFLHASKLEPRDYRIFFNIALCCLDSKDVENAQIFLEKSLNINPEYKRASEKLNEIKHLI